MIYKIYISLFFITNYNYLSFYLINTLVLQTNQIWLKLIEDYCLYVFKKYIYTINHKRIALNYLFFTAWSAFSGLSLATMIRWELAYPGSHFFKGDSLKYLQVITAHGLTMVFYVVIPIVFGFLANFIVPYHVGSKDVAYPRLNSIGFWFLPAGFLLVSKPAFLRSSFFKYFDKPSFYYNILDYHIFNQSYNMKNQNIQLYFNLYLLDEVVCQWIMRKKLLYTNFLNYTFIPSLFIFTNSTLTYTNNLWYTSLNLFKVKKKKIYITKCSNSILTMSGWTFVTPFSAKVKYTGLGSQDLAIISALISGLSTTISFTNLLITRRTLSMPGLKNRRVLLPFITISLFLTMRMLTIITPVLGAALLMLLMDRHWRTSFFDYAYGGDVILFNHLFWFFGHPEVYVIIIPVFGLINMIIPLYNTRRIASKHHLIWASYIMAYMGFLVWGHHMYLVGLDHRSRSLYSTITVMIALPAIVKIINWTLTLLNGFLRIDTIFLFFTSFFFFFLCGGLTGMWLSHVSLNIYTHDTFYVVAHFHFLFSGSTFSGIFLVIYYYFHILFGLRYSKFFSYFHWLYWTLGQWLTFLPLFWVGYNGLPRRYHDYPVIFLGWHGMSSIGHLLTLISIFFFFLMFFDSIIEKNIYTTIFLGIPRFYKRINYFYFKINFLQNFLKIQYISQKFFFHSLTKTYY
jgi:heme/copper-type cytochrome/quinol oxidase subunit 1